MNKVILIGRLTRDPEIRYGGADVETAITDYTLAVDKTGRDEANFIRCRAIGNRGDFAYKYLRKGMKIAVEGELTVDSWEDGNERRYMTYVLISSHEFCEPKKEGGEGSGKTKPDRKPTGSRSRK